MSRWYLFLVLIVLSAVELFLFGVVERSLVVGCFQLSIVELSLVEFQGKLTRFRSQISHKLLRDSCERTRIDGQLPCDETDPK